MLGARVIKKSYLPGMWSRIYHAYSYRYSVPIYIPVLSGMWNGIFPSMFINAIVLLITCQHCLPIRRHLLISSRCLVWNAMHSFCITLVSLSLSLSLSLRSPSVYVSIINTIMVCKQTHIVYVCLLANHNRKTHTN